MLLMIGAHRTLYLLLSGHHFVYGTMTSELTKMASSCGASKLRSNRCKLILFRCAENSEEEFYLPLHLASREGVVSVNLLVCPRAN